jgi:hypothetical protein
MRTLRQLAGIGLAVLMVLALDAGQAIAPRAAATTTDATTTFGRPTAPPAHDAQTPDGYPAPPAVTALLAWAAAQSGYAVPLRPPAIAFWPAAVLAERVCAPETTNCGVGGYYRDGTGEIVLNAVYRGRFDDVRVRSLLVHEIVHYLQDHSGRWHPGSCTRRMAREREAVAAQQSYLVVHGGNPFGLRQHAAETACTDGS